MYVNSRTGQLMANPRSAARPLFDFYIAPQQYDPGSPERSAARCGSMKGTTTNIDGTGFTFRDFNADRSAMMRARRRCSS